LTGCQGHWTYVKLRAYGRKLVYRLFGFEAAVEMVIARTLIVSVVFHMAVISLAAFSPYFNVGSPPGDDVMLVELKGGEPPAKAEETSPPGPSVKPPPARVRKSESPREIKKAVGKEEKDVRIKDIEEKDEVKKVQKTDNQDALEKAEKAGEDISEQTLPSPLPTSYGDKEVSHGVTPLEDVHAPDSQSLAGSPEGVSGPPGIRLTAVNSPLGAGALGGYEEDLIGQIREAIRKATLYPAFARQRRMEGTVVAGFFINGKGMPEDIRVIEGSGHRVLDREVVRIIKRAAPYPPLGAEIEVPISFRLLQDE
jgi:TonB family protein